MLAWLMRAYRNLPSTPNPPPRPYCMVRSPNTGFIVARFFVCVTFVALMVQVPFVSAEDKVTSLVFESENIELDGKGESFQILVSGLTTSGQEIDLTHDAQYEISNSDLTVFSRPGMVESVKDGTGFITVKADGLLHRLSLEIRNAAQRRPMNFENDIVPILSRFGCNTSGCHGKAEGKNGFKLSVFGFDADADYEALTKEVRGRRVSPGAPGTSLILMKAIGRSPHGGGTRLTVDRPEYNMIHDWIASGMPVGTDDDPVVVSVEIFPKARNMQMSSTQQLQVIATMSNGRKTDVTRLAQFQSNNEGLAKVDETGRVTAADAPGIVAVMATYKGYVNVFQTVIPRVGSIDESPNFSERNFIDKHVYDQLKNLNIIPSGEATDADYLRRIYIDLIGTLPTVGEAREFLGDDNPNKRAAVVDHLLKRPEYADYWALKWADLLRVDRLKLGRKQSYEYYKWIRGNFAQNKTFDKIARDLLTVEGPVRENSAAYFYSVVGAPNERASTLSQILLGIRIECAQCHHHPYDRWSQKDYYGMQAFFTQVKFKNSSLGSIIYVDGSPETKHPRTGEVINAFALGEEMPEEMPSGDRRDVLADWMTSKYNRWFAQNIVNRTWAHFMGRGIIEPVDDVRLTNPPTNPELLDALAKDFVDNGYDMHHLVKRITQSAAYQRSSEVNATNERDEQNFSRFLFKQLEAEVLVDAISHTTGITEKFEGVPGGSRAIQLWDSAVPHYMLKLFGRPARTTVCDCERVAEPTVGQVLHVLNSPVIHDKVSHVGGQISRLVEKHADDNRLAEELYLTFVSRFPNADERQVATAYMAEKTDRKRAVEDLAWSLMNSLEFLFNH